jgi:hypothetical protein
MAFGLFFRARNSRSSQRSTAHFSRGRRLRCEPLESREMLSVNPVLGVFIHGFQPNNQGSGIPNWYSSMESGLDAAVLARDTAAGSQINGTVHQTLGPDSFSITNVDNTKNLDLEVDWYSGFISVSILGVSVTSMSTGSSVASSLATAIENFLHYEYTTYGTTWDVYLVGYSRGGFVAQNLTTDMQSYVDSNSSSISLGYVEEVLLDPTGVIGADASGSTTTFVVPTIVDRCINYNDTMNLAPLVCVDGLTMTRADGSSTGISNVNTKSSIKSYLSDQGLLHWYTVSYVLSENSHVYCPDWYIADQLTTDVTAFVAACTTADA